MPKLQTIYVHTEDGTPTAPQATPIEVGDTDIIIDLVSAWAYPEKVPEGAVVINFFGRGTLQPGSFVGQEVTLRRLPPHRTALEPGVYEAHTLLIGATQQDFRRKTYFVTEAGRGDVMQFTDAIPFSDADGWTPSMIVLRWTGLDWLVLSKTEDVAFPVL